MEVVQPESQPTTSPLHNVPVEQLFSESESMYEPQPGGNHLNKITAQGKSDQASKTSTVLHHCIIAAAKDLGDVKTYLGRPWKQFSMTVVMQCSIDKLVDPSGWEEWIGHPEFDQTVTYRDFGNQGPEADTSRRAVWLGYKVITTGAEVEKYTIAAFIYGAQ
ncbi:pectinesterase/pectinesterase inhibitor 3-like [Aristolochia californica]|uniref:pectinesterase/pectinesterase inhibitor 3-like n=1 Tax=Aristolochia californica TaxID=171875 RepID=UPI0035DC3917